MFGPFFRCAPAHPPICFRGLDKVVAVKGKGDEVRVREGSEDLEAFEQGECGGSPFALGSGRLHRDQLGGGGGGQLLVARGREGGDAEQRLVLADVDGTDQTDTLAAAAVPLRPPHCLVENVLHGVEVPAGRHLEEQTTEMSGQGLPVPLAHLSEEDKQVFLRACGYFFKKLRTLSCFRV